MPAGFFSPASLFSKLIDATRAALVCVVPHAAKHSKNRICSGAFETGPHFFVAEGLKQESLQCKVLYNPKKTSQKSLDQP
jgi:hypothetical protein